MSEYGLTKRQADCLTFIRSYSAENEGASPAFTDIMVAIGLASKSGVHRILHALEERGLIVMLPHRCRSIRLTEQPADDEKNLKLKHKLLKQERSRLDAKIRRLEKKLFGGTE